MASKPHSELFEVLHEALRWQPGEDMTQRYDMRQAQAALSALEELVATSSGEAGAGTPSAKPSGAELSPAQPVSSPDSSQHQERFVVREMLPNKPGLFAIWDNQLRHYPNSDRDREKLQLACDILNQAERDGTLAEHGLSLNA